MTDGVDTASISTSVIMAGLGLILPVMLSAIVCGCMGAYVKLVRRTLMQKTQNYYEIKRLGESKFNSVKRFELQSLK